jgi:hypothetical protein
MLKTAYTPKEISQLAQQELLLKNELAGSNWILKEYTEERQLCDFWMVANRVSSNNTFGPVLKNLKISPYLLEREIFSLLFFFFNSKCYKS